MTTLIDTIKPAESDLLLFLDQALEGRTEAAYVADFMRGMGDRINSNPQLYHSYGPWWPAMKTLLLESGDLRLGQSVDADVAELYAMSRPALTILAAFLYSLDREQNEGIYNSVHFLPVAEYADDTEPYLYVSSDDSIEKFKLGQIK